MRFVVSDQYDRNTINIAAESFQCVNDSKQFLLCNMVVSFCRHHLSRPESNRPTFLNEDSTKPKARSVADQLKNSGILASVRQCQAWCSGQSCLHTCKGILTGSSPEKRCSIYIYSQTKTHECQTCYWKLSVTCGP